MGKTGLDAEPYPMLAPGSRAQLSTGPPAPSPPLTRYASTALSEKTMNFRQELKGGELNMASDLDTTCFLTCKMRMLTVPTQSMRFKTRCIACHVVGYFPFTLVGSPSCSEITSEEKCQGRDTQNGRSKALPSSKILGGFSEIQSLG